MTVIHRHAYEYLSNGFDEYCMIVESTVFRIVKRFCLGIDEIYFARHLRIPIIKDLRDEEFSVSFSYISRMYMGEPSYWLCMARILISSS